MESIFKVTCVDATVGTTGNMCNVHSGGQICDPLVQTDQIHQRFSHVGFLPSASHAHRCLMKAKVEPYGTLDSFPSLMEIVTETTKLTCIE